MPPCNSREKSLPYISFKEDKMEKKEFRVQRLVMVCPIEEIGKCMV